TKSPSQQEGMARSPFEKSSTPTKRTPPQRGSGLPSPRCYHVIANGGGHMPQLLVRDVPRDVIEALKRRAAEHGRSAEAEHRAILEGVLKAGRDSFRASAARLRDETRGRIVGESAELIREDRDSR